MVNFVILAAGIGSRLGRSLPKPLTLLNDGRTIMQQQVDNIKSIFGSKSKINIVVGYKYEYIVEAQRDAVFIYNEQYDTTNTSKSLLKALHALPENEGILWMNGDVVFNAYILEHAKIYINNNQSFVAVNTANVGDEEVKYTVDAEGYINKISKIVPTEQALGEAVGINYIAPQDIYTLKQALKKVNHDDYFEKGLEDSIRENGLKILPFDITKAGLYAVEIDFEEDLTRANLAVI